MRGAAAFLLLLPVATAQDEKRVTNILVQANAEYEAAKELWNKFVFTANDVTDAQLGEILAHYDKAIKLCQKASETGDSGEADTMVLRLARRTAQLRATAWAREMRARAEAVKREKPAAPDGPEPAPEKPPEPVPEKPPERKPAPGLPPPVKPPDEAPAPESIVFPAPCAGRKPPRSSG